MKPTYILINGLGIRFNLEPESLAVEWMRSSQIESFDHSSMSQEGAKFVYHYLTTSVITNLKL